LGATAQLELRVDAAEMVLGGLRADEEPLRDLGVRQPLAEQAQDLELALAQQPLLPGPQAAPGPERAQQRGGRIRLAVGAERLELPSGTRGRVDRGAGSRGGLRTSELEPGASSVERQPCAVEQARGLLERAGGAGIVGP